MLRSLMTAVTGVRAHQTMLDVTGNNIANANTTGFKKDMTVFADLMYQSQKTASGPGDGRGGINPAQVGLGVSTAAIETIFTQGASSYTGNTSDMMINGNGFFIYNNGTGTNLYSRAGACVRDANNDLVQSGSGYKLQGYAMSRDPLDDSKFVRDGDLSNINIPLGKKLEPHDTTEVKFQCNLDSRSEAFLPYGYSDIPYNTQCGWTGNPSGTIRVTLNGIDCDISVETLSSGGSTSTGATSFTAGANGTNYMQITIDDGINTNTLVFDMTGVSDGLPVLTLNTTSSTNSGGVVLGPAASPTNLTVDFDSDTGVLKLKSGSETLYRSDLTSAMNYKSFSLTSSAGTSIPVIAEFDESVTSGATSTSSDLSKTHSTLTMWYYDTTAAAMQQMTAEVYFNADGTFDYVDAVGGTLPSGWAAGTVAIEASEDGTSLLIKQDKDPATGSGSFNEIASITQGGYHQTKQTIYDCDGNAYTMEVNFKKITENRWRWEAFILDSDGNLSDIVPEPHVGEIEFCGCGPICNAVANSSSGDVIRHGNNDNSNARAEIEIPFSMKGSANTSLTLNFGGDGDELMGVTQFASETTTKAVYQNGYLMGIMENYSIGVDGTVTGIYTNGQNIPLYRVALATFANEQGLDKVGGTMFRETVNSGNANIDPAGINAKGEILSQNVEMSNVDLTEEFTHLIIAQRGFQANTRVITTSDQILEEVVNLKR